MNVIRVTQPGTILIAQEPIPTIHQSDQILVQVKAAGICGSDVSIYQGTSPVATYPRIIGHEFAGEVIQIGEDVTHVNTGDHVVINPVVNCGHCRVCQKGHSNVCVHLKVIGVHVDGGYQEYVTVPASCAFPISPNIPWNEAAIIEPYTVAAQVASRGEIAQGDTVLICGSGQIALTILQVCNILGAKCITTDIVENRLTRAKEFGAWETIHSEKEDVITRVKELTDGLGADVAIDAACVGKTLEQAALGVRPGGIVVTMGFHDTIAPIKEFIITSRELDIRGSRLNNNRFPQVISWFESKQLDPSPIITDTFHFTEIEQALEKLRTDPENTMKIILTF